MRATTSKLTSFFLFGIVSLLGAAEDLKVAVGFNFVNGVGLKTPTYLELNQDSYRPKGYKAGATTQGGMLYEGAYTASVKNGELKSDSLTFSATNGSSPILASFLEDRESAVDGVEKKSLALMLIPNRPTTSQKVFWAIMLDRSRGLKLKANGRSIDLQPLKMERISEGGNLSIKFTGADGREVGQVFSPDTGGNFILFFFDSPDGPKFSFLLDEIMSVRRDPAAE